ncbi:SlyX family protein [uncultured Brevundimonas sp.]|uniref:SlyX family protein n=1 Tax=uncultured Brevundimonas sp. TaxID=213418 RepID=UPI0025E27C4C|nr:SlyX family protein [uncultured Brevundimonas sp.]
MVGDRLWGLGGKKKPGAEPQYESSDGSPSEAAAPSPRADDVPHEAVTLETLHQLLSRQQRQIETLSAEVAQLRRRLDTAMPRLPADDDEPLAPFPDHAETRGPGDLAEDFFEQAPARPARKPVAPTPATRPAFDPTPSRASTLCAPAATASTADAELIAQRSRAPEFKALLVAYQGLLDGAGGMAEFQRAYGPDFVTTGPGETLRPTVGDEEGPFWFIPLDDRPSLGLLLPSDGPIQQWGELYQFGGGTRAQSVFGRAFEVEPGNVLQLMEPAWIRFDGDTIRLEKRGRLRGA